MKEETRRHLACLDGWRGLAILFVLLGHFVLEGRLLALGLMGVDLFFVLSGRLMAEILFVRRAPLPTFFLRRFSRVYPALLVFVVVTTLAAWNTPYRHGLAAALTALTFTTNYAMLVAHPIALLDHVWSLCVEEHGYVILALVAVAARRWGASPMWVAAGLGTAALVNGMVQLSAPASPDIIHVLWRTDVQVAPLFISGALFLAAEKGLLPRWAWLSPVCLAAGVAVKLYSPVSPLGFASGTLLLALSVVTLDQAWAPVRRLFETAALGRLGMLSFSLYLWQQPFYKLHRDDVAPSVLLLGAALILATASFYGVEKPARRLINGWRQGRPKPAVILRDAA